MFTRTTFGDTVAAALKAQENGKYQGAMSCWQQVLDLDGNYDWAYAGIGKSLYQTGEYREAVEMFRLGSNRTWYSRAFYDEDLPLIQPMYYQYPEAAEAYEVKNQDFFGTELIAAPVTSRRLAGINRGKTEVWLPEGLYTDFFTGMQYRGVRKLTMYRDLQTIPVPAKAGAIVPMTDEIFHGDALKNPETLCIRVFPGADGHFRLYEDDINSQDYKKDVCAVTQLDWNWETKTFTIQAVQGKRELLPSKRGFTLEFYGVKGKKAVAITRGEKQELETRYDTARGVVTVELPMLPITQEITVTLIDGQSADNQVMERILACFIELRSRAAGKRLLKLLYESLDIRYSLFG